MIGFSGDAAASLIEKNGTRVQNLIAKKTPEVLPALGGTGRAGDPVTVGAGDGTITTGFGGVQNYGIAAIDYPATAGSDWKLVRGSYSPEFALARSRKSYVINDAERPSTFRVGAFGANEQMESEVTLRRQGLDGKYTSYKFTIDRDKGGLTRRHSEGPVAIQRRRDHLRRRHPDHRAAPGRWQPRLDVYSPDGDEVGVTLSGVNVPGSTKPYYSVQLGQLFQSGSFNPKKAKPEVFKHVDQQLEGASKFLGDHPDAKLNVQLKARVRSTTAASA